MAGWIPDQFRLTGGINEEDPAFTLPAGFLTFCRNYECLAGGGYRRIEGYERFDGHAAKPSLATYSSLAYVTGGPRTIVDGDIITGATSGATAHVVGVTEVATGDWITEDAAGNIGLAAITGTFVSGESITVGGVYAAVTADTVQTKSVGDASYKSWLQGARDYYRTLISKPPGVGPVRGGFVINGDVYCFRDLDATPVVECAMYKATTSGWTVVDLGHYLPFDTGTIEVAEGATVTGLSSSETAVVLRTNIAGGNYAGPSFASGHFAIATPSGAFTPGEDLQVGGVTVAKATADASATTLLDGGRYQCLVHNFYGAADLTRVYGCDGVNNAFEFDGTVFCQIETGMTVDTPTRIEKHRGYLFLAFPGGSVQHSATGLPLTWSVRLGAEEIGVGGDITDMRSNGNLTLAITTINSAQILQGASEADWVLRSISDDIGSVGYTMQETGGQTLFLDRAGINIVIPAPFTYQDLATQAISRNVRKTIERTAMNAVDSFHALKKNQYRLLFNDKTALVATYYGSKLMGFTACLYAHQFTSSWGGVDSDGVYRMYVGTDDGYVMEMDSGTSFDGTAIESILQLPYSYHKSADRDKRFHKISLEVDTPRAIDLRIITDFDYGGGGQSGQFIAHTTPTGGLWDVSSWEQFFWDSAVLSRPEVNIDGVGLNIGITLYHNDAVDDAFTISAMLLQFSLWGVRR